MSQLSMCDVNESQPGDAGDQQLPSQDEAASASNGVGHTHKGPIATSDEPTVGDALASDHTERVQHLKTLLGQSASDLDLQVMKLKADRAEMVREKTRLSAQLRNTERKRRRLCNRATKLSTNNFQGVYAMRVHAQQAKNLQNTPAED